jgi:hypothetical protein
MWSHHLIEGVIMNTSTPAWNPQNKFGLGFAKFYGITNVPLPVAAGRL